MNELEKAHLVILLRRINCPPEQVDELLETLYTLLLKEDANIMQTTTDGDAIAVRFDEKRYTLRRDNLPEGRKMCGTRISDKLGVGPNFIDANDQVIELRLGDTIERDFEGRLTLIDDRSQNLSGWTNTAN